MAMFKEVNAFSGFSVKEIDEAIRFYKDILGLEISRTMGQLVLHIAGGGTVFVYAKPNHVPATFTVLNFPVVNLQESMHELRTRGVEFIIYKEDGFETDDQGVFHGGGPKIAWFKDPFGNILSVLEEDDADEN